MSYLPTYTDSIEKNSAYIRQILPSMMKYNVPVNPINYTIWYHYIRGDDSALNNAIDSLIRFNKKFDSSICSKLYKTYICNTSIEFIEKVNSSLQQLIEKTAHSVNATSEKVSVASDSFTVKLKELGASDTAADLKAILFEIISETTQLAEVSKVLKNELDNSNKELEQLRSQLTHVRKAADTDGLTGLLNRGAFDKVLGELIENTAITHACLVILDIDHFKRVNDSFGHLVGDKVIKYFASLLKKYSANNYHVARYGGEEMAIIMPDTNLTEAFNVIEEIRLVLDKSRLKHKGEETIGKVTVSAGIASLQTVDTANTFIERADKALYRAKQTGRNKVLTEKHL